MSSISNLDFPDRRSERSESDEGDRNFQQKNVILAGSDQVAPQMIGFEPLATFKALEHFSSQLVVGGLSDC